MSHDRSGQTISPGLRSGADLGRAVVIPLGIEKYSGIWSDIAHFGLVTVAHMVYRS
jgi:hypothetical protein